MNTNSTTPHKYVPNGPYGGCLVCDRSVSHRLHAPQDDVVWLVGEVTRLRAEARRADALLWQVEHEGCAASRIGETTYECRADAPCGLCRLRAERNRLRAALHDVMGACDAECAGCGAYYVAKKALDGAKETP